MGSDSDQDVYLMENTVLSDMIDDEGQRLMFTFDYMTDRSFFMEMKELIPGKNLMTPRLPPQQLPQPRIWTKSSSARSHLTKTSLMFPGLMK